MNQEPRPDFDLSQLDVATIRESARAQWYEAARKQLTLQERIARAIPWMLAVVALGYLLLSAPHTMDIVGRTTPWPWLGLVAPMVIEAGLFYAAFSRKMLHEQNLKLPNTTKTLAVLSFVGSLVVNGAGALVSVVRNAGLEGQSYSAIIGRFGDLPITTQAALFMVPVSALLIPIGTSVAGEGLAALAITRRKNDMMGAEWQHVRFEIEFYALRDAALGIGVPAHLANAYARRLTGWSMQAEQASAPVSVSDASTRNVDALPETATVSAPGRSDTRPKARPNPDVGAAERVRRHLSATPEDRTLSVRVLASKLDVSKSVAHAVKSEFGQIEDA